MVDRYIFISHHKTGSGCNLEVHCRIRVKEHISDCGLGLDKYMLSFAVIDIVLPTGWKCHGLYCDSLLHVCIHHKWGEEASKTKTLL